MKELEYPFDAGGIVRKKEKLRKQLLSGKTNLLKKKIAILGGSTTENMKLLLELFLLNNGIQPEFYESQYNQYYQEAMFPNRLLEGFRPDIIYIYTTCRNIEEYPHLSDSREYIDNLLKTEMQKYEDMWFRLADVYRCTIIQNNFELPFYRLLGNKDASDIHGAVNYIGRLNNFFYEYAQTHYDFYICDINYISADYGLKAWFNPSSWYMYKYAMDIMAIPYLAFNVANIIKSIYGKNKKGIVLDLDNTIWGGIIGEDGIDHIALGPETAKGQAYLEFQKYLKKHRDRGILLSIDSKNDYQNALAGLNHPEGCLKLEDFTVIKANWEQKDINFMAIAEEIGVLPESLIFVDDNPAERTIVEEQIAGVCAPDIQLVQNYITIIDRSGYFEATTISADDIDRADMYKKEQERRKLQSKFENYEEYLVSLGMKAEIKHFHNIYMARIAQLVNKSNQFNLTAKRYTQAELEKINTDKDYITLYGRLEDRFGNNGVVSVLIAHCMNDMCNIELFLMSCRVLKRNLEFAMLDALVGLCNSAGIKTIIGYYYPTGKNTMVENLYDILGFRKIEQDQNGNTKWELDNLRFYHKQNKVIEILGEMKNGEKIGEKYRGKAKSDIQGSF